MPRFDAGDAVVECGALRTAPLARELRAASCEADLRRKKTRCARVDVAAGEEGGGANDG